MEPTTPLATTAASVGLTALLAGAVGQVAADVMMVFLASMAGTFIAISASHSSTVRQRVGFFLGATSTALTLSWAIASLVASLHPALASAYTPTIIAFAIGTQSMRLGVIANKITGRVEKHIDGGSKP
jgi:hypothetical protein